jgi:hypothetical protein
MKKSKDRALFQATVEDWPESKLSWSETYIDNSIKRRDEENGKIQDAFGELAIGFCRNFRNSVGWAFRIDQRRRLCS